MHCNSGKTSRFRTNPEFTIRYLPPRPYPPRHPLSSPNEDSIPSEFDDSPYECDEPCSIPSEHDSAFCLQAIQEILESCELQWEELGEDVLTIWNIYLRASPSGLLLLDAGRMSHVLLRLGINYPRISYAPQFVEIIAAHLAGGGLRIRKLGELEEGVRLLAYALTMMGYALCACVELQPKLLYVLKSWVGGQGKGPPRKNNMKVKEGSFASGEALLLPAPLPVQVLIRALEISRLPRVLGEYLQDGSYSPSYIEILKLLRRFCECSEVIRCRLGGLRLLDPILLKLCLEDKSYKILGASVHFIYALVGRNVDKLELSAPHEGTFQFLITRLFLQLREGSCSKSALNLRNDCAFLLTLIAGKMPPLGGGFGRYAPAIAAIVSRNVLGEVESLETPYLLDATPEDAELLKSFVWMLDLILKPGVSLNIIEDYHLVPTLLFILLGPSTLVENMRKGAPSSYAEELEIVAWSALMTIAKMSPASFLVPQGAPLLIDYFTFHNNNDKKHNKNPRLLSMLSHILRTLLSHSFPQLRHYFTQRSTMRLFIQSVVRLTAVHCSPGELPLLSNLLLCCAALSAEDSEEEFSNENGVRVLLRLIRQLLYHPANERHMDPVLHISIAECAMRCIAHSASCLETFLAYEGILRMLDFLEVGAGPAAALHTMNCILQLCEYPRCVDQLLFWRRRMKGGEQRYVFGEGFHPPPSRLPKGGGSSARGTEGMEDYDNTLSALLCQLWRDEEERWGVLRDSQGCISSLRHPLSSAFSRSYTKPENSLRSPVNAPGPATLDSLASIRPKLFLLAKRVMESGVSTEAELFGSLSLHNQVTLQILLNFLDLKRAEIWMELGEGIEEEGIRLVESDAKVLEELGNVSRNKVRAVVDLQRYLIQRKEEEREIRGRELGSLLSKCELQENMRHLKEADYMARTTSHPYLVERRLWQKTELEKAATAHAPGGTRLHRTTNGPLNITVWPNRLKIINSELHDAEIENAFVHHLQFEPEDDADPVQELILPPSSSSTSTLLSVKSSRNPAHREHPITPSSRGEGGDAPTPPSAEPGYYQVSGAALKKALEHLLGRQKKNKWMEAGGDDNYWKMRAKWKLDWYPDESGHQPIKLSRRRF